MRAGPFSVIRHSFHRTFFYWVRAISLLRDAHGENKNPSSCFLKRNGEKNCDGCPLARLRFELEFASVSANDLKADG